MMWRRTVVLLLWLTIGFMLVASISVEAGVVIVFILGLILWAIHDDDDRKRFGPRNRGGTII